DALTSAGVPHVVQTAGTLFSVFFREQPVHSYEDAKAQDTEAFTRFFHAMLEGGIYLPPSAFEAWFVSTAHTPEVLDRIAAVLPGAAKAAAGAGGPARAAREITQARRELAPGVSPNACDALCAVGGRCAASTPPGDATSPWAPGR